MHKPVQAAVCNHQTPRSNNSHKQANIIVDCDIVWTALSTYILPWCTAYHAYYIKTEMRSNEKLTLKWYKKGGEDPGISPFQ